MTTIRGSRNLLDLKWTPAAGNALLLRVQMWCARRWSESRDAALVLLAGHDAPGYLDSRANEAEWFAALLVVNRISLGIEPNEGRTFVAAAGETHPAQECAGQD